MSINVVSLFSGGGGLDLGFIKAGYNVIWAIDNEKSAVDTYKYNIGNHILHSDINDIKLNEIPFGDIIIGGPPCQSFSLAGNRNPEDIRGQLVWKYIEIIDHLKPYVFVFENVTGLKSARNSKGEKILPLLEEAFNNIGYTLSVKVLNTADYGVPQLRRRVIIVGLRGNKQFEFPRPVYSPENYITVSQAINDLPEATCDNSKILSYDKDASSTYQQLMRENSISISDHVIPAMSELDKLIISYVKPGGNYMDIPTDISSSRIRRLQNDGGHTTCYGRMDPDKPSYTINTYFNRPNVGCNIHYKENRLITIREALRLQSFPDTYQIIASSKQGKNKIVGNAVPPIVSYHLARELKKFI